MADPLTLEPGDYWKLRYTMKASELAKAKGRILELEASAASVAHQHVLATKYPAFDLDGQYRLDDETMTMHRQEGLTP